MFDVEDVEFVELEAPARHPMLDDETFQRHLSRLTSSLTTHSKDTICDFLVTNTYLRGVNFSFVGHEYQKFILEDKSKDKVVIKSAQMGISEMSGRMSLAMGALIDGFSTIYTLPSAKAAQNFMKTRIDPVIESSPYLREIVSKEVDNTDVKKIGESYLYMKGCQVDSQAISVPADFLVTDEVDNSNPDVMTLFESRLIHSPYQWTIKLSTPSIPNYGIDRLFKSSRRFVHMCRCTACHEWFLPDYYEHVRIPGFKGDLMDIGRNTFSDPRFRWQEAYVGCPKCGKPADLSEPNRNWVCENPNDTFIAAGFMVSPFSCPSIILPSHLVDASVKYARKQDFYNQRLGKALEDKESTLTEDELRACLIREWVSTSFPIVMGLDMGNMCACTIMAVLPEGQCIILHTEMIPLFTVFDRRKQLAAEWKVRMCVVDHGPYTETVYRMQRQDKRVFAGVYVRSMKSTDLYKVKDVEEDKDKGVAGLQQVNIARDRAFDFIMGELRAGNIKKIAKDDKDDDLWVSHLQDQKRVREFVGDELVFTWNKTSGEDHYHHSLLYAIIASKILGVAGNSVPIRRLVRKIKVRRNK